MLGCRIGRPGGGTTADGARMAPKFSTGLAIDAEVENKEKTIKTDLKTALT